MHFYADKVLAKAVLNIIEQNLILPKEQIQAVIA